MEVRSQGEDQDWPREDRLKASVPQLAGMESGKKSGQAREARDICLRVRKERVFLLSVPTEGRASPKRAPKTGANHGYQLGPQRWA